MNDVQIERLLVALERIADALCARASAGSPPSVSSLNSSLETESKKKQEGEPAHGRAGAPEDDVASWVESLKAKPAYVGIDIDCEFGKCEEWCRVASKKFTRRRFINWLNRIERPMTATPGVQVSPQAAGIQAFLNRGKA